MSGAAARTLPRARSALAALAALGLAGCGGHEDPGLATATGDAARGREAILREGCGTCHVIPGIAQAVGVTGPALGEPGRTAYVAGVLPNVGDALVRFIRDPQAVDPRTAMPNLGISEAEANDIVAYLLAAGTS